MIDASKAIALGYFYLGDPRDMFCKETSITQALPLGTILTLAATGSEMDPYMVISIWHCGARFIVHISVWL